MKWFRWILYITILLMLYVAPLERLDVAKLLPIQAVAVYTEGDSVVLETDTENKGKGASIADALQDLKENTPAVVYLDTAEFLMVSETAVSEMEEIKNYLKPSVKVCVCDAAGKVKDTAKYLDVHRKLPKLKDWNG